MKALKIIVVVLVLLLAALAAGMFALNRYVQSPAFQQMARGAARKALHTEFDVRTIEISLFRGVKLQGVKIANPSGYPGSLLTADSFVLRYRLLPLLHRRLEIQRLSLGKPVLTLSRNEKGEWNYDKLLAAAASPGAAPSVKQSAGSPGGGGVPLEVSLTRLAVNDGEITILGDQGKALAKIQKATLTSAVNLAGGRLTGQGQAKIGTAQVGDALTVSPLAFPWKMTPEEITLSPLSGKCAGGTLSGNVALKLAGGFRYLADLQVQDADLTRLLTESGSKPVMSGRLRLTANVAGSGGLDTIEGKGNAEIVDGRLLGNPVMNLLASLLQAPELRDLQFQECRLEFQIATNVMLTPVIRLTSPHVQITGQGAIALRDYSLNHDLTLAIAQTLFDRLPGEVQRAFADRGDGFRTVSFHVQGPYDHPTTDLPGRLAQGAIDRAIQRGLKKFLK